MTRLTTITGTTLDKMSPTLPNLMADSFKPFKYALAKKNVKLTGGHKYYRPALLATHGTNQVDPQAAAAIQVSDTDTDAIQSLEYTWSFWQEEITVNGAEDNINMGDAEATDIVKGKIGGAISSIGESLNAAFFSTISTVGQWSMVGLRNFITHNGQGTVGGLAFNAAGVGADVNARKDWSNRFVTGQADYTDLGEKLLELWLLQTYARGKIGYSLWHPAIYAKYEKSGQDAKFIYEDKLDIGFMRVSWKTIPIMVDYRCLNGAAGADESVYMIDDRHLGFFTHPKRQFRRTKFAESQIHPDLEFCWVKWMGSTWCDNRKVQGVAVFSA